MNLFKNNWESPTSEARLSTVFNNRNQHYGAYVLRKEYDQTILRAFIITFAAGTLLACAPLIKSLFFTNSENIHQGTKEIIVEMTTPDNPIKPEEPQKKENSPKPSDPNTIKDVVPTVVTKPTTDTIRTQSDLSDHKTGLTTNQNDTTGKIDDDLTNTKKGNDNNNNFVFHGWVEVMPSFPGGESAMMKFLSNNLKYPERAKDAEAQGTVLISFIVDKEGNISSPTIKRGIGFGCEEEAIRVIKNMPAWSPGKMNGQAVNVEYVLPIRFTMR